MTPLDVVTSYGQQWRALAAWGAPLPATLTYEVHKRGALGRAWSRACAATIRVTGNLGEDLSTVLHELAHLAAPDHVHHNRPWRRLYVAAAAEALRCDVDLFELDVSIEDLDAQVVAACDAWLADTGQLAVLRSLGVIPAGRA